MKNYILTIFLTIVHIAHIYSSNNSQEKSNYILPTLQKLAFNVIEKNIEANEKELRQLSLQELTEENKQKIKIILDYHQACKEYFDSGAAQFSELQISRKNNLSILYDVIRNRTDDDIQHALHVVAFALKEYSDSIKNKDIVPALFINHSHLTYNKDFQKLSKLIFKNKPYLDNQYTNNNTILHAIAYEGFCMQIKDAIQLNLDINAQNDNGNTPLHIAAKHGYFDTCRILLQYGANPHIKNEQKKIAYDLLKVPSIPSNQEAVPLTTNGNLDFSIYDKELQIKKLKEVRKTYVQNQFFANLSILEKRSLSNSIDSSQLTDEYVFKRTQHVYTKKP